MESAVTINFAQAIIKVIIELSPALLVLCFVFIIFSWLRVLIDSMSGRGL